MIKYKIYYDHEFEETHRQYFDSVIKWVQDNNFFAPSIAGIIITDKFQDEIAFHKNNYETYLHIEPGTKRHGVAFLTNGRYILYFDALAINGVNAKAHLLICRLFLKVWAAEMVSANFEILPKYKYNSSLAEIVKFHFGNWAAELLAFKTQQEIIGSIGAKDDFVIIKFVNSFKAKIKRLQTGFRQSHNANFFLFSVFQNVDLFILNCIQISSAEKKSEALDEFLKIIPLLVAEIETQTINIFNGGQVNLERMEELFVELLNLCAIDVLNLTEIELGLSKHPSKLFSNVIDTEQRIVAYLSILGFKSIIEHYEQDGDSIFLFELHNAVKKAIFNSVETMSSIDKNFREILHYKTLDGSVIFSLPFLDANDFHTQFRSLANLVNSYNLNMMESGFFIRGGISLGSYYAEDNIVFSKALVNAQKLASEATFPVISLDEEIADLLKFHFFENNRELFMENLIVITNVDNPLYFLNPFEFIDNTAKYFEKISPGDFLDDPELFATLESQMKAVNAESLLSEKYKTLSMVLSRINYFTNQLEEVETEDAKQRTQKIIAKFRFLGLFLEWLISSGSSKLFDFYLFE